MDYNNSYSLVFWDVNLPKNLQIGCGLDGVKMVGRVDSFLWIRSTDAEIYSFRRVQRGMTQRRAPMVYLVS